MKQRFFIVVLTILTVSIFFAKERVSIDPFDHIYKYVKNSEDYNIDLYNSKESVLRYVKFLISTNLKKNDSDFEINILDKNEDWLVVLFYTEYSEDIIIDRLDNSFDYAIVIKKKNGETKIINGY